MLSVVITTRADGYGGGNLWKTLDHYHAWCEQPEIVLVDWNSPNDTVLWVNAPRIMYARVSPEQHNQFPAAERLNVFYHIGQNYGIRLAHCRWVLSTSQDALIDEIDERQLQAGCFYRLARWDQEPAGNLAPEGPHGPQGEPLFTNAAGDFILMEKSAWEQIRGYPEWPVHSIYLDGLVCYQAHLSGLREVVLPGHCVHQWHRRGDLTKVPHLDYVGHYAPLCEYMLKQGRPIRPNDEGWGTATPGHAQSLEDTMRALGIQLRY